MQCNEIKKIDIGPLVLYEVVINKRFVVRVSVSKVFLLLSSR